MSVAVSTMGRWHHFELAQQLEFRGYLQRLFTGYPRHKVDVVSHSLVSSFPYFTVAEMAASRWGIKRLSRLLNWPSHDYFDRWVAANLEPCDILTANHGNGLHSFRRIKEFGGKAVCDSGQAHPNFIRHILNEEYARWGAKYEDYTPRTLAKRLEELEIADLITVPSSFNVRTFLEYGVPAAKLKKISYGVDLSMFYPEPKTDDIFRVMFVGAAGIRKGLGYLLQAFVGVKLPRFELVIVGGFTPDAKPVLERYAGKVNFKFAGFVPRKKLRSTYSQGSVLVLPSMVEGLAYVQAQAMACGLPVIATANAGAEDLFTDSEEGYIIPPRDPDAIRDKVLHLYHNPDLQNCMGKAALLRVRTLGGWESYGNGVVATYDELLYGQKALPTVMP